MKLCRFSDLPVNIYQTCSCLYILYRHCLLNISLRRTVSVSVTGVNCDFRYWIFKNKLLTSKSRFRLACICFVSLSYHCLSVSVLKYLRCVNEYFAGFVASYLCLNWLSEFRLHLTHIYLPEMKKIHSVLYIKFS